jgi:hypothetical protein
MPKVAGKKYSYTKKVWLPQKKQLKKPVRKSHTGRKSNG